MAAKVDWYYHRKGCISCQRAQAFLTETGAEIAEQVDPRKIKFGPADAIKMARQAHEIWVAKGKKIQHLDLKQEKWSDDDLSKLIVGPTGNLRAPTVRCGKRLFVGFHPEWSNLLPVARS